MAEAINAAETTGADIEDDAKEALAETLNKIADEVVKLPAGQITSAANNLADAIGKIKKTNSAKNALTVCMYIKDGKFIPTDNNKFKVDFKQLLKQGKWGTFTTGTIEGQIWLDESNNFQMEITGTYDKTMLDALGAFKDLVNNDFLPKGKDDPIKINPKALKASLEDTQKALKKNAFIFYDFTKEPPIMFTQMKNHFGKLESSVFSYNYDDNKWKNLKKPKAKSIAPALPDFTGTSNQQSDSSKLKISANKVTNVNSDNNEEQLLLKYLQSYRPQQQQPQQPQPQQPQQTSTN